MLYWTTEENILVLKLTRAGLILKFGLCLILHQGSRLVDGGDNAWITATAGVTFLYVVFGFPLLALGQYVYSRLKNFWQERQRVEHSLPRSS